MTSGFTKREIVQIVLNRDSQARPSRFGFGQWKSFVVDALLELQTKSFKSKGYDLNPDDFRRNSKVQKDLFTFCKYTKRKYNGKNKSTMKQILCDKYFDMPWNEYPIELFTQKKTDQNQLETPTSQIEVLPKSKSKMVHKVLIWYL